jgi:hypothetical protein
VEGVRGSYCGLVHHVNSDPSEPFPEVRNLEHLEGYLDKQYDGKRAHHSFLWHKN